MTQVLRQSTAVDVLIGPFLDLTDGATAETGETPTVKLSKNGQALAAKSDITTPVHDADGYYNCEFDTTDTNTVGTLILTVAKSATALPVRHEFMVIEEAAYDALYASGAAPKTGINVSSIDANVITATSIASDAFTAAKFASDVTTEFQSGLATAANLSTVAGYLDTEIAAILEDTGTTLPAQISALNNLSAAQVNAEVDTAITDAALATAANLATVDTVVDAIKEKTDSLAFTVAGQVDANIQYVNDVAVTGNGQPGTEWGP